MIQKIWIVLGHCPLGPVPNWTDAFGHIETGSGVKKRMVLLREFCFFCSHGAIGLWFWLFLRLGESLFSVFVDKWAGKKNRKFISDLFFLSFVYSCNIDWIACMTSFFTFWSYFKLVFQSHSCNDSIKFYMWYHFLLLTWIEFSFIMENILITSRTQNEFNLLIVMVKGQLRPSNAN